MNGELSGSSCIMRRRARLSVYFASRFPRCSWSSGRTLNTVCSSTRANGNVPMSYSIRRDPFSTQALPASDAFDSIAGARQTGDHAVDGVARQRVFLPFVPEQQASLRLRVRANAPERLEQPARDRRSGEV